MSETLRREIESQPLTVADVRYEQAAAGLIGIGLALTVIATAYGLGFIVGRLWA